MRPKWGWGRAPAAEVGVGKGLAARMRMGPWGNAHDWTMNGCVWLVMLGRVRLANWLVSWAGLAADCRRGRVSSHSTSLVGKHCCALRLKGGVGGWAGKSASPKWGWGAACFAEVGGGEKWVPAPFRVSPR